MTHKEIKAFAVSQGYDDVEFLREWNGWQCYEPILNGTELTFTGLPLVVMVRGEEIRMSTADEAMEI